MFSLDKETTFSDKQIREARDILWQRGILYWKLDACQKKIYDFYMDKAKTNKTIVINASRRLGKSYVLLVIATEICLQNPGTIIKYVQPTRDMIKDNLNPDFEATLEDCPLEIRPTFKTQGNVWLFPNGSRINLAGTDGKNYNKLRGGNADLCIVDEAGFCSDLKHIINSILLPLTTITKGKIILSSTTPTDPDHEFNGIMEAAEVSDTLIRKTFMDAVEDQQHDSKPRLTKEIAAEIIAGLAASGGENSDAWRCEYMCERIGNSDNSVLPEFTPDVQNDCIREWPRPVFYDRYVAQDLGFADLTVVIFAYWDYDNAVLVIEDEYVQKQGTTSQLAENIRKIEKRLWTNPLTREFHEPYMRISDNNLQIINDLQLDYGLFFMATEKHNKLDYMQRLREMVQNRQIIINPKCKTLISHMKSASWDKQKKDFKRSPDHGHYDGVAALLYLSRNIDKTKNPYPTNYRYAQLGNPNEVFRNEYRPDSMSIESRFQKLANAIPKPQSSFKKKVNK